MSGGASAYIKHGIRPGISWVCAVGLGMVHCDWGRGSSERRALVTAYLLRHITNCDDDGNGEGGFFVLFALPSFLGTTCADSVAAGVAGAGGVVAHGTAGDWSPAWRFFFFPMVRHGLRAWLWNRLRGQNQAAGRWESGSRSLVATREVGDVGRLPDKKRSPKRCSGATSVSDAQSSNKLSELPGMEYIDGNGPKSMLS